MKMNDIRGEYGAEFITRLTDEFVSALGGNGGLFSERELRDEIARVREHDHEPLFLEMMLPLLNLMLSKYRDALQAHKNVMELDELQLLLFERQVNILDGIVDYMEKKPKRIAREGGIARHNKTRSNKNSVLEYWTRWQSDPSLYVNQDEFARDMLEKFGKDVGGTLTSVSTIVRKWIPEFRRDTSSG